MPTPIPADDLRPDVWVTLRPLPEEDPIPDFLPGADHLQAMMRRRRRSSARPGTPMRILAVDLPYLFVAVLDPDGDEVGPVIIDLHEQPVVRLDESVPEAIRRFADEKRGHLHRRREEIACREAQVEVAAEATRRRGLEAEGCGVGDDIDEASLDRDIRRAVKKDVEARRKRRRRFGRPDSVGEEEDR